MKLPVLSDGVGRELIYPGACLSKEQAKRYGDRNMPKDLKKVGFRTHVFTSDPIIHGSSYYRLTYGKDC
jgi:hypothetical protein